MKINKSQLFALLKEEFEQAQTQNNNEQFLSEIEEVVLDNINNIIENVADYWIALKENDPKWKAIVDKVINELRESIRTEDILKAIQEVGEKLQKY